MACDSERIELQTILLCFECELMTRFIRTSVIRSSGASSTGVVRALLADAVAPGLMQLAHRQPDAIHMSRAPAARIRIFTLEQACLLFEERDAKCPVAL